jgi:hypothetical protein
MRRLLLILGLGGALAMIAAGTASSLTVGGVDVGLPTTTTLPSPLPTTTTVPEIQPPSVGGGSTGGGDTSGGGTSGGGTSDGGSTGGGGSTSGGATSTGEGKEGAGIFGKHSRKQRNERARLKREIVVQPPIRNPDGSPTKDNPGLTVAQFGPAPIGVPNFVIDSFEIPPFLLPIYQAYGAQYGIPWQVLASINRIETDFGRNLNVSSAGAMGWMQFIPSSWEAYGCDGNQDGIKDPYNPVDAICAAARYLHAAGGEQDIRSAIFSYNHADWYVDEVLLYANQYGKLPSDLIGSLTGLTEGAHFPVAADARYADDIAEREAMKRSRTARPAAGNAADVITGSPSRRSIDIYSDANAPVIAVNDGVITATGENKKLGKFIVLTDAYGNRYTYAGLGAIAADHPVPKQKALSAADFKLESGKGKKDRGPAKPASKQPASKQAATAPVNTEDQRQRLSAFPATDESNGLLSEQMPGYETFKAHGSGVLRFDPKTMKLRPLKIGSRVTGGTVLGRIGDSAQTGTAGAPHLSFAIRPAGRGAPRIDPKPILDGWKLLETTAIYRATGENPFGSQASIGQILLMSKETLAQRTLADPRIQIYSCGRTDIESGQIDRRVMAVLEYLAERGYRLTITSLKCGHSFYTSSGNVSAHSSGNAVDIAQVNGTPILGHQGAGSITEAVIRDLLQLQGTMRPAQIISLMELGPPTFSMADHDDHIHVGYTPLVGAGQAFGQLARVLKPDQWQRLIGRLQQIENPKVPEKPSEASLPTKSGGSRAHRGE